MFAVAVVFVGLAGRTNNGGPVLAGIVACLAFVDGRLKRAAAHDDAGIALHALGLGILVAARGGNAERAARLLEVLRAVDALAAVAFAEQRQGAARQREEAVALDGSTRGGVLYAVYGLYLAVAGSGDAYVAAAHLHACIVLDAACTVCGNAHAEGSTADEHPVVGLQAVAAGRVDVDRDLASMLKGKVVVAGNAVFGMAVHAQRACATEVNLALAEENTLLVDGLAQCIGGCVGIGGSIGQRAGGSCCQRYVERLAALVVDGRPLRVLYAYPIEHDAQLLLAVDEQRAIGGSAAQLHYQELAGVGMNGDVSPAGFDADEPRNRAYGCRAALERNADGIVAYEVAQFILVVVLARCKQRAEQHDDDGYA